MVSQDKTGGLSFSLSLTLGLVLLLLAACSQGSTTPEARLSAGPTSGQSGRLAAGDLDQGGGPNDLIEPIVSPVELTDWNIVPFTDPRTGETYEIIDGRVTIAFKDPPQLPLVDPNYFDVERQTTDPVYVQTPAPTTDPEIAAFIAAENLVVVNEWNWVKSIGALLPQGQSVLDAVSNWPTEYPDIILSVDPDVFVPLAVDEPAVPPDDDRWEEQWAVTWPDMSPMFPEIPGSPPVNGYPLDIVYAWDTGDQDDQVYRYYNGRPVEVAILDTGVDYDNGILLNEDLISNSDSIGCNVGDDRLSTTFQGRAQEGGEPWMWLMSKNPYCAQANGHGTCVASIISAKTNNDHDQDVESKDIAGIAYNPLYFPISMKCFANASHPIGGYASWVLMNAYTALGCLKGALDKTKEYHGLISVPNRNIEVANCSYGGANQPITQPEIAMLTYLTHYILFVCSTGNEGLEKNGWPARMGSTLSVAAYNRIGHRASFSNFAPGTNVAAPGVDIWTNDMVGYTPNGYQLGYSPSATTVFQGTSSASPHVAAIAILVTCKFESVNYGPGDVKARILSTQATFPPLYDFAGRIVNHPNAFNALYNQ